jgi:hypothetical protein
MVGHLQKLVKHGFMVVTKLEACHVPEDPAFPSPVEGYMVVFVASYERGFGTPPHRLLLSLPQYYILEVHHLSPS